MIILKFIVFLLLSLSIPTIRTVNGIQQRSLPNLRQFTVKGVIGRFIVDRDALEQEIQVLKQQDAVCGQDAKIELPKSVPHASYNVSFEAEAMFVSLTLTDVTLLSELPDDLKQRVATTFYVVGVVVPVVIGTTETHALLSLQHFTNSTENVTFLYDTNVRNVFQADGIEELGNGTMTVRLGDDVMVYQVQDDVKCEGNTNVGKDFDKMTSKEIQITNYPLPFNWSCELLGSNISFCQRLDGFRCELARVGGDVCTVTSTTSSERSPSSMKIVKMTGKFREMIPYLAETTPNESFEAELFSREHTTGIVYPCLTV